MKESFTPELLASDRYFASLLQQAQDAILPLDGEGRIVTVNRAAEVLLGVAGPRVVGRPLSTLAAGETAATLAALVESARAGAPEARSEIHHGRPDGSSLALEVSVAPVRAEGGQPMGFLALARDVTERRKLEAERTALEARERAARVQAEAAARAEAANRAKDEFVATLSHELRTPLNSTLGWARLLRTGQLDPAMTARAIGAIERSAVAQAQLIDDLFDVSRMIQGKLILHPEPVELPSILEAAREAIWPAALGKEIEVQLLFDPEPVRMLADPHRLEQVLRNLLSNAVKFTPRGGNVKVTLERINSHVEIAVHDTGEGIAPDFLPFVFNRFSQADGSLTRRHGGLGLGLAIVRHLVELHGGKVWVQSAGEGQGATFTVALPLNPAHTVADPAIRVRSTVRSLHHFEPSRVLEGMRLLVVEDEPDTLDLLVFLLESCGAKVESASSARQALDRLAERPVDLLLSDMAMPDEDGCALLQKARALDVERGRWTPAIALTAYARPDDGARFLSAGFQVHLPKPVDPPELVAVILGQTRPR